MTLGDSNQPMDFIRVAVMDDLKAGRYNRVNTCFQPEPNGYLHIGHAKAMCIDFGIAAEFGGQCNLRFDDTNPVKEEVEYVESIQQDIREYRGTLTRPGKESPYRNRTVEDNLDLFARMRVGEFPDGSRTLRAKIDMASGNINLRDPVMYRIIHATHHRTGNAWCVYPMYDFAHGQSDSIEGITHSLCSLEYEDHRPLYDWYLDALEIHRPRQIEFARLNVSFTVLSKRKLLRLVQGGHVKGWDDPRMPTLSGLCRRGYTPEAIRDFCDRIGVAKKDSMVDIALLEHCLREDLNKRAPRVMGVLKPLRVVIENYPEGHVEEVAGGEKPPKH